MLGSEYTWVALALVIVLGAVLWKGLKPILAGLDARAERIRREIEEAQSLREEAQKLLAEWKRRQRDALKEAEAIVTHAQAEAERLRKAAEADLTETLERRERLAMEKIAQAEAQALAEVRGEAVELAIAATAKVIAEQLDEAKRKSLVEAAIGEVAERLR